MRSSMPTQARAVACLTLLASADGIRIPGMGPGKGSGKGPGRGGGKIGSMVATSFGASEPRKSFPAMYNALLAEFPYQTKAIGTGITYIFSDSTAQLLERDDGRTPSERIARSLKFGAVGALWVGPLLAGWFQLMDSAMPGKTLRPVMAKLLADQMLQGPFMIGTMFWWTSISNGATLAEARQKIEQHLWPTWVNSVYVWGPVQAMQQVVVPLQYRVLVANGVSYFWDTYLSLMMMDGAGDAEAAASVA